MFDTLINTIIGLTAAATALLLVVPLGVFLLVRLMTRKPADDYTGENL